MNQHRSIAETLERGLRRESHNLSHRPDLLWQQLYNGLWGEAGQLSDLIDEERASRCRYGSRPWLRSLVRAREPKPLVQTLAGHAGEVTSVRFFPRGRILLTAGEDGSQRVWDADSGRQTDVAMDQDADLVCLDVSVGGRVSVGDIDGRVSVRDGVDRAESGGFAASDRLIQACSLSPSGDAVTTGGVDGSLVIWSIDDGRAVTSCDGHEGGVLGCTFHPSGRFVVSVGVDGSVAMHDASSGAEVWRETAGHGPFHCCACSPSGTRVATAGEDGCVRLWAASSGEMLAAVESDDDAPVLCCAFGPSGRLLAGGDQAGVLRIWDSRDLTPITVLRGHKAWINDCAFAADESLIASAGGDETAKLWTVPEVRSELSSSKADRTPTGHGRAPVSAEEGGVLRCAFTADGATLVTAGHGGVGVWDVSSGGVAARLPGHQGITTGCAFMPYGGLLTSGTDGTLMLWDLETRSGEALRGELGEVRACAVSDDGELVAAASRRAVHLSDAGTGHPLGVLQDHDDIVYSCVFDPQSSILASASADTTVKLWDVESREPLATLRLHRAPVTECAFSPSGELLATAGFDHMVVIWEMVSKQPIRALKHHNGPVRSCSFAPDGSTVVSAGWDKAVRVADVDSGLETAALLAEGNFMCCSWSPSNGVIGAGDEWDAQPYMLELEPEGATGASPGVSLGRK